MWRNEFGVEIVSGWTLGERFICVSYSTCRTHAEGIENFNHRTYDDNITSHVIYFGRLLDNDAIDNVNIIHILIKKIQNVE